MTLDEVKSIPANSYTAQEAQEEKHEVNKVISGSVKTKKKPIGKLMAETFLSEDIDNVGNHILKEVLVPKIVDLVVDVIKSGTDMIFYGNASPRRPSTGGTTYVSYNNYSKTQAQTQKRRPVSEQSNRLKLDFNDILMETKEDAEAVLETLWDLIATYQMVSVAEFYDAVGVSSYPFTLCKYGWTNLMDAKIMRCREGYYISLPKAVLLQP